MKYISKKVILKKAFSIFTKKQKRNVLKHLNNNVEVLAGEQANLFSTEDGL